MRTKSLGKCLFLTLFAIPLIFAGNRDADATLMLAGSSEPAISLQSPGVNQTWAAPIVDAMSTWNGTSTPVYISFSSSSPNTLTAASYSDTWYGLNTQSNGIYTFKIQLNSRTINRDATNFYNFVKATTVHEFGHCFFLADNPNTTSASIMKYSTNFNVTTTPQTYDINDVNTAYDY